MPWESGKLHFGSYIGVRFIEQEGGEGTCVYVS